MCVCVSVCLCVYLCVARVDMLVCLLGHNKSGLGQPQPTTHCAQSTVDWHTHTVTHTDAHTDTFRKQVNLCSHWSQTRFHSTPDFKFQNLISNFRWQLQFTLCRSNKSAWPFVAKNCHLLVAQSANKLSSAGWEFLALPPSPFPCPSSPSVAIRQFFSALILLDVAFVHIFNAINSLSEHCFTANRLDKGGEGAWLPVSR